MRVRRAERLAAAAAEDIRHGRIDAARAALDEARGLAPDLPAMATVELALEARLRLPPSRITPLRVVLVAAATAAIVVAGLALPARASRKPPILQPLLSRALPSTVALLDASPLNQSLTTSTSPSSASIASSEAGAVASAEEVSSAAAPRSSTAAVSAPAAPLPTTVPRKPDVGETAVTARVPVVPARTQMLRETAQAPSLQPKTASEITGYPLGKQPVTAANQIPDATGRASPGSEGQPIQHPGSGVSPAAVGTRGIGEVPPTRTRQRRQRHWRAVARRDQRSGGGCGASARRWSGRVGFVSAGRRIPLTAPSGDVVVTRVPGAPPVAPSGDLISIRETLTRYLSAYIAWTPTRPGRSGRP